jgi:hypothetical protein
VDDHEQLGSDGDPIRQAQKKTTCAEIVEHCMEQEGLSPYILAAYEDRKGRIQP